jgi:hypothetical protein
MFRRLSQIIQLILSIFGQNRPPPPSPVPCSCADCPSDPNLTGSYTGEDVIVQYARIANAYRGNLFLCPGSAMGLSPLEAQRGGPSSRDMSPVGERLRSHLYLRLRLRQQVQVPQRMA